MSENHVRNKPVELIYIIYIIKNLEISNFRSIELLFLHFFFAYRLQSSLISEKSVLGGRI